MPKHALLILVAVALSTACSSAQPRQIRADAVLSGEKTAELAAAAAREAAATNDTGLIYASSQPPPPPEQPAPDPAGDPAPFQEGPTSVITIDVTGDLTQDGEATAKAQLLERLRAHAAEAPELLVVLVPAEGVDADSVQALQTEILGVGVKQIQQKQAEKEESPKDPAPPSPPVK